MKVDYAQAFTYILEEKNWVKKIAVLLTMHAIVIFVLFLLSILTFSSDYIADYQTAELLSMLGLLGGLLMFPITKVVSFYLTGYNIEMIQNIMESKGDVLPEHNNIAMKYAHAFVVNFIKAVFYIPAAFLFGSTFILTFITTFMFFGFVENDVSGMVVLVLALVTGFVFFVGLIVFFMVRALLVPAALYRYLTEKNFMAAFDLGKVWDFVGRYWGELIKIHGLMFFVGVLSYLAALVTCFIPFVIQPMVTVYTASLQYNMIGQLFRAAKMEDAATPKVKSVVQNT